MRKLWLLPLLLSVIPLCALGGNSADAARTNAKLGLAYLQKGYFEQSKERLLSALRDDPHIAASWYSMAYYLERTGNKKGAEQYYQKALSVDPHSGSAQNNYGTYLCRMGRYQEAFRYFNVAVKEPAYIDSASAYQNAGTCALMIPNVTLAKQYFQQALDNNPNMPFALLSLARLNYQAGDDAAADRYFDDFKKIQLHHASPAVVAQYEAYVYKDEKHAARLPPAAPREL